MNNNNQDVEIKISVDTSDVDKSMKKVEKSVDKMGNSIEKAGDNAEDAFDGLEKELKDINKQMKNLSKDINLSGLTKSFDKAMNTAKKSVSNAMKSITSTIQKALNIKSDIEVNAKTTTDATSGASSSMMGEMLGNVATGGAMGSQIAKSLAQAQPAVENVKKAFKDLPVQLQTDMSKAISSVSGRLAEIVEMTTALNEDLNSDFGFEFEKTNFNDINEIKASLLGLYDSIEEEIRITENSINMLIKKQKQYTQGSDDWKFLQETISLTKQDVSRLKNMLTDIDKINLSLGLDKELAKLDELIATYENKPLKINAQPIIEQFTMLQQKMKQLGMDTSFMDAVFEEWNYICQNGTKSTLELGNAMRTARNDVATLHQGTKQLVMTEALQAQKQTELASSTNIFDKAVIQAKYGVKQLAQYLNNLFVSMKNNKALDETAKKAKRLGDETQKASKKVKSATAGMMASFKGLLTSMLPFLTIIGAFNLLKTSTTEAMDSIETSNMYMAVFGKNASKMDEWISQVNKDMGLSVSQTKQFTAIVGQMGSAMGLSSDEAMGMAQSMATMAGDISSFYNADITKVQEDLRSALSGSYETMDKYGVILRENTIKQFAYKEGIARTGAELTNAQRAMATTLYIEQALGQANGDMARTMDTPAGRARRLSNALADLRVALGNIVLPIYNAIMPGLIALANALTTIFNKIASVINGILNLFGKGLKTGSGGGMVNDAESIGTALSDGLGSAGGGSGDIADNLSDGAKSAKEIQKSLMGIDEINNLSSPDKGSSGGSGSGGSGGTGGGSGDSFNITDTGTGFPDAIQEEFEELVAYLSKVIAKIQGYWQDFMNGFNTTFDATAITDIKNHLLSIGDTLKDIATDENVLGAFDMLIRQWSATLGAFVGTAGNLVAQIVEGLVGGFDQFLSTDADYIKGKLVNIFNIKAEAMTEIRKALYGLSEIFNAFGSDEAKTMVANIMSGFATLDLELGELASKLGRDFAKILGDSIYDNATEIKTALEGAFSFIGDVFGTISETLRTSLSGLNKMYDEHIKPFVDSFSQGFSDLVGTLVDGWNTHMQPVLDNIAKKFDEIMSGNVGSAIQSVIDLVGSMIDYFKVLWEDTIKPCVEFVIDVFAPTFAMAFETVSIIVLNFIDVVAGILDGVIKVLTGVVDFITGVFSLDLDKALGGLGKIWEGLSKVVSTVWDSIWENSKEIVGKLASHLPKIVKSIKDAVVDYFKELGEKAIDKLEGLWEDVQDVWDDITDVFEDALDGLVKLIPQPIKDIVKLFTGGWKDAEKETDKGLANVNTAVGIGAGAMPKQMADKMSGVVDTASTIWGNVKSGASTAWSGITSTLGSLATGAKDNVKDKLSGVTSNISTIWSNVKSGASTGWSNIKSTLSSSVSGAKNQISTSLDGAKTSVSNIWSNVNSGVKTGWNTIKSTLNSYVSVARSQIGVSLDGAKTSVNNIWTSIKNNVGTAWSGIKTAVNGKVNEVKNSVNGMKTNLPKPSVSWDSIKTTAQNTINKVKNVITGMRASLPTPNLSWANSIKTSVQNAINKVKSCFNFSWSLPKPKLPKFTPKYTTIAGVRIPTSFSVTWHRRGGILPDGSNMIFGMNGNSLMAGGERGTGGEAILPLNKLWDEMATQFNKQTEQIAKLTTNNNSNQQQSQPTTIVLQLDGRELARGTVNNMSQLARVGQLNLDFL